MTNGGNESSFFLALRKKSSSVLEPNSHMTVASGGGAMTGYIHRLPIKDHKDYVAITPKLYAMHGVLATPPFGSATVTRCRYRPFCQYAT